ncbi:MAG: hypothetical protein Ct9H300mP16_09110 [Pseudomonadota bacterium]|nr:MAG: hypothetical protein Ct9H300mP16_09110 [Pseudomonadota bacterium]
MSGEAFALVDWLTERGKKVFVDLKFFDVPATVGRAVRQLNGRGSPLPRCMETMPSCRPRLMLRKISESLPLPC